LFGQHTLNQILTSHGCSGKRWWKALKSLTVKQIEQYIVALLQTSLKEVLADLMVKSGSTWSRASPVVVIDDSVFRQWLSDAKCQECFGRYFSGQTKSTVNGFCVTLCGLAIGDTFYPASLRLTTKKDDTKQVACELLAATHALVCGVAQAHKAMAGTLYLSVDNGFESPQLLEKCAELSKKMSIFPIFVPKSNARISVCGREMKVSEAAEGFDELEKQYLQEQAAAGNKAPEPFVLRIHAHVKKIDAQVVMLFFRLKGSKKISTVYTTDRNIKAKTLRRRWFQRTHIEQFFRIIKDTVKIQQSTCSDEKGFKRKLFIAIFKALHCQLFRNYCRKLSGLFKKWGFVRLRQRIIHEGIEKNWFAQVVHQKW
jgi:hypothetical protein